MRLQILTIALAATINADKREHHDETLALREQNKLTIDQMPPACNLAACLGLSGTATCIVSAIGSGDPAALQRCLVNGLAQICSCAACVPLVDNFLISLGVCVTRPGSGNQTEDAVKVLGALLENLNLNTTTTSSGSGSSSSSGAGGEA